MTMPLSNYPGGFANGVSVLGVPILNTYSGDVFWVNSNGGSNGNKGTRGRPFAALDYAIGRCAANNGDVILVAPNHAETITGVAGLAFDVAGITVIGLGTYNQRPRFLMDAATTVTAAISAADVTLQNLVFAGGHSDIVTCFTVTAKGATFKNIHFEQNTTDENFLSMIKATGTTDGEADGLTVKGCSAYHIDASTVEMIELNADVTDGVFEDNVFITEGTASPLILCATGKDLKGVRVLWNFISHKATSGNLFISNDTASPNNSGLIAHNRCRHADVTGAHTLGAVGGCGFFDNLSASTDAVSGFVLPAIDVDL